ncbi:hypothetical protein FKM82_026660 [Ascaphus truei]
MSLAPVCAGVCSLWLTTSALLTRGWQSRQQCCQPQHGSRKSCSPTIICHIKIGTLFATACDCGIELPGK